MVYTLLENGFHSYCYQAADGIQSNSTLMGTILYNTITCRIFYHGIIRCCQSLATVRSLRGNTEKECIGHFARLAKSHLEQLTDRACSSLPYCLGEVDEEGRVVKNPHYKGIVCYKLIWPIALVADSSYSTDAQAQFCKETLRRIHSMHGIKLAGTARDLVASLLSS